METHALEKGVFLASKMIFTRNFLIFHAVDESSIMIKNIIDMKKTMTKESFHPVYGKDLGKILHV